MEAGDQKPVANHVHPSGMFAIALGGTTNAGSTLNVVLGGSGGCGLGRDLNNFSKVAKTENKNKTKTKNQEQKRTKTKTRNKSEQKQKQEQHKTETSHSEIRRT